MDRTGLIALTALIALGFALAIFGGAPTVP